MHILIEVDISELSVWYRSKNSEVPVAESSWGFGKPYVYEIYVLHAEEGMDWYFHKTAGEFAHSLKAIIELDHFKGRGLSPVVEYEGGCVLDIEFWRGQLSISFSQKLIAMVPLIESLNLQLTGKTSNRSGETLRRKESVPVAFSSVDKDSEPTLFWEVNRSVGDEYASYWNQLTRVTFNVPDGTVVVRSQSS